MELLDSSAKWLFTLTGVVGALGAGLGVTGASQLSNDGERLFAKAIALVAVSLALAAFARLPLPIRGSRYSRVAMARGLKRLLLWRCTYEYDEGMTARITAVLGGLPVQSVTVRDVRHLLAETATFAERTRYGMLATFRQVMKMARDEGLIIRDPSEALQPHERPKQKAKRKGRRLSPEQLQHAIEIAERRFRGYAPLIVLLAYTGMRIREALGLRWEDVDLDAATIRLRWQLTKDCQSRVPVKTEAGARDLPTVPALRRRLIAHRLASPWTRPADPVFAATNGRPKQYRNVRRVLDLISAELGVEIVSHDFRRSLASYPIIAARADEGAVTGVLGHTNIATTRRLYAADWREAEERNEVVLRQLADAGIGQ